MKKRIGKFVPVKAADSEIDFDSLQDLENVQDAAADASDAIGSFQDAVSDMSDAPADSILNMDNNIENHYIAECERCHEVFISAMMESENSVDCLEGECPCCHENTKQDLKWIVRDKSFGEAK